jgi:hypothetical protein
VGSTRNDAGVEEGYERQEEPRVQGGSRRFTEPRQADEKGSSGQRGSELEHQPLSGCKHVPGGLCEAEPGHRPLLWGDEAQSGAARCREALQGETGNSRNGQEYQSSADVRLHKLHVLFAEVPTKAGLRQLRRSRRPRCPRCLDAPAQQDEGRTQYHHGEIDPIGEE